MYSSPSFSMRTIGITGLTPPPPSQQRVEPLRVKRRSSAHSCAWASCVCAYEARGAGSWLMVSLPAHVGGGVAHADHACGRAADDCVCGHVLGDDRARADDAVLADAHPAQDAGAVADPDVVSDGHVALVDALCADRPLDLGDAVVEVDQHHAVGDDALAPERHVLEGRDRALLAHHRLRADADFALVDADLAAMPDPRPAADAQRRITADLELDARADEADPVGLQAPTVA